MYEGSDVLVGTVGRITRPSSFTPAEEHRHSLRTLFEGGAWAVGNDRRPFATEIPISGTPPLRISVQTAHADTAACVRVRTASSDARRVTLLAVHTPLHAEAMLRSEWSELDIDKAIGLVQARSGMAIFALLHDGPESAALQRVLRALYDLGLTAQQPHRDATVVVVSLGGERMQATSLLSLLSHTRPADLLLREIGKKPRKPRDPGFGRSEMLERQKDPFLFGGVLPLLCTTHDGLAYYREQPGR
jgi:hypothetical protein